MSTDFFKKLDEKVSDLKKGQQQAADIAADNREFLEVVVSRLNRISEEYAEQVKARGIAVDLNTSKYAITFTLKYKGGGHHGVILGSDFRSGGNRIEITGSFTGDDGKNYKSTSGITYDCTNWNDAIFVSALERCIEDYISYAPRHGGL